MDDVELFVLVFFFYLGEGEGSLLMGYFWFLWVLKCCGGVGEELHNTMWAKASDIYCSALKLSSMLRGRTIQIRPTCFWPWKCRITTWEHHNLTEWICYSSNLTLKTTVDSKLVGHGCKMGKETVPDTASWELLKLQKLFSCLLNTPFPPLLLGTEHETELSKPLKHFSSATNDLFALCKNLLADLMTFIPAHAYGVLLI